MSNALGQGDHLGGHLFVGELAISVCGGLYLMLQIRWISIISKRGFNVKFGWVHGDCLEVVLLRVSAIEFSRSVCIIMCYFTACPSPWTMCFLPSLPLSGCPFRHWDKENIRRMLTSHGVSQKGVTEILYYTENSHYQLACQKHFEITHSVSAQCPVFIGCGVREVVVPQSRKLHNHVGLLPQV